MKAIKLIIILLILGSCTSGKIDECGCEKTTYYYEDLSTEYIENVETYIVSVEDVSCVEPVKYKHIKDNLFYTIECN